MIVSRLLRLVIVSTGIRRDLVAPLNHFSHFELLHFYRFHEYGDLTAEDFDATLHRYVSPLDLYRQLISARANVIQDVEPFSIALAPYLWACYFAARKTNARLLVVTLENRPLETKFGSMVAFALRAALRHYFARACLVIVLNEGARENVLACGVAPQRIEKLMWGTWGVDLDEFSPYAPMNRAYTILFAGRLHQEKGIFVLLDAFSRMRERIPNARLLIIGDGLERQEVERRAQRISGVELHGAVKNRAMPSFFNTADVVVMPSLTTRKWEEQVGMVAIQAMACGVPVIATNSGAIPEYVPNGIAGVLVRENDSVALAEAMTALAKDNNYRHKLGRAARDYACAHYDARLNIALAEKVVMERCCARSI